MFTKVLIANRGEIARRVTRSCQARNIQVVAVCSEADKDAPFVKDADEHVVIGPAAPKESYLNVDAIIAAAKKTGAQAIHPGYGFLSESEALVSACEENDIVFIGPPKAAILAMGSKIEAKAAMRAANVPTVPGTEGALGSEDEAAKAAEEIGYPVMLKASAGGGGIGMTFCKSEKKLRKSFEDAQKKGEMFFGSSAVFVEKFIEDPHHIEVQILADQHGNVRHLFDRECSIQRRHQKVLEEAPSPFISDAVRKDICETAVRAAQAVDYVGAGTVEFVVGADQSFYFLEMNTRLQVEHPITEMITGVDIVDWQLRVAAGEKLDLPEDLATNGHAIELRLCAEDPQKRFFPSPGTLSEIQWPKGEGVRIDAAPNEGEPFVITPYYDSMFAKMVVHGKDRADAIAKMQAAVAATKLSGVAHNLSLHEQILVEETFQKGVYTTAYIADVLGLKA